MHKTHQKLKILVIEDNVGDFILIRDYLIEELDFPDLIQARTFEEVKRQFSADSYFDVILLDLTLPDARGEKLVMDMVSLVRNTPIIVLTGYTDKEFSIKTLSLGISDYIIKDELTPSYLGKSIAFSIERKQINKKLRTSENNYRNTFDLSPLPMWIYDPESLRFLKANKAAVKHYGYSETEFQNMTIVDIRPKEDRPLLLEALKKRDINEVVSLDKYRHVKKNGEIIIVDIHSNAIDYDNRTTRLVVAHDITEKVITEENLKKSEEWFRAIVQEGSDLISIFDKEGKYIYQSPSYKHHLELDTNSFIGKHADEIGKKYIHPDDLIRIQSLAQEIFSSKKVSLPPYRFSVDGKNWFWLETTLSNMYDNPSIQGVVGHSRDITQRFLDEKRIKDSHERYLAVAKATSDAIYDCNFADEQAYISGEGFKKILGYDVVDTYVPDTFWKNNIHPEDREQVISHFEEAIRTPSKEQWSIEYRFRKANGDYAYILDRFSVLQEEGKSPRVLGAMQDISEHKYQEKILALEKEAYELNANTQVPFSKVLDTVLMRIESLISGSNCSILQLQQDGQTAYHLAAPSLSKEYIKIADGLKAGPVAGSCGTAMFRGENVFVRDIESSPLWKGISHFALKYGYKACWSVPIKQSNGKVLGSFATYHKSTKNPGAHEVKLIERAANLIGVILENRASGKAIQEAKERYDIVAKATSDVIWDLDVNNNLLNYSFGIHDMMGYKESSVTNVEKWMQDKIHPEDFPKVYKEYQKVLVKGQKHMQIEYRFRTADGSYKFILDRAFAVAGNDGKASRVIGAMQDISKKKSEELRLKLMESVITHAKDAVLITDADHTTEPKITYVNEAFCKMTGYSKDELIGNKTSLFHGPKTDPELIKKMRQALKTGEAQEIETINYRKDGTPFWVNFSTVPITDKEGKPTHWISIERDTTDRKIQEQEREQMIWELSQNNTDLRQFAYITSHNLRSPLSNLIGILNLIDELEIKDPELEVLIDGFRKSTHMLNDTVDDLGKIVVIRNSPSVQHSLLSFEESFSIVQSQIKGLIDKHKPTFTIDFQDAPHVTFHKAYLESIFLNLLTNAIKYRSPDRKPEITIRTENTKDYIILRFEDNGIGIDTQKFKDRIFGLYQRFHNHPDSKGLGLYLIKSQIETLGGKIEINSKVNRGTSFILYFSKKPSVASDR